MKLNRLFLSTMLIFIIVISGINAVKPWCWTKSMANEPGYNFDATKGGINWGYCKATSYEEKIVKYQVDVFTSSLEDSETRSNVMIQLMGTLGQTDMMTLSQMGFERGSHKKIEIEGKDIGDITKLLVSINGSTGYRCSKFGITKDSCSQNFDCLNKLEPCTPGGNMFSCMAELLPDGDMEYEITIKTSDNDDAGCNCGILFSLIGSKGSSNMKMFSECGAEKGNTTTKIISVNDIGVVSGYELKISGQCKWKPSSITVKTVPTGEVVDFELENVVLISPGQDSVRFDNNQNKSQMGGYGNNSDRGVWPQVAEVCKKQNQKKKNLPDEDFDFPTKLDYDDNEDSQKKGNKLKQPVCSSNGAGSNGGLNINDCNGGLIQENEKKSIYY
jgi:hypothetical protein